MLSILADGDGRYRLLDQTETDVGWIRGRIIAFGGMASEAHAFDAVAAGWPVLQALLEREFAGWPRKQVAPDQLRLVHDGAYEWISDGRTPLARLDRSAVIGSAACAPGAGGAGGSAPGLAIQFVLPSFASEGATIAIAQVLGRTLAPHMTGSASAVCTEPVASRVDAATQSLRSAPPSLERTVPRSALDLRPSA